MNVGTSSTPFNLVEPASVAMTAIRLVVASLAVFLSLGTAYAADPEQTGSIDRTPEVGLSTNAFLDITDPIIIESGKTTSVILPELSVTSYTLAPRPLPPLKPLPKWDPHVCIGC